MVFLVVLAVLLAVSYVGAVVHSKILINKGENKADIETKITNTGASVMVLGVMLALFMWPAGKPWYKTDLFLTIYNFECKYITPDKSIPKSQLAEAERYDVTIRAVLLGAIVCILSGVAAQFIVRTQAKSLAHGSSTTGPKAPRSPWSGQTY